MSTCSIGHDQVLGAFEVLAEQDLGGPGDRLGHPGRQLGGVLADLVEGVVERRAEVLVLLRLLDDGVVGLPSAITRTVQ